MKNKKYMFLLIILIYNLNINFLKKINVFFKINT